MGLYDLAPQFAITKAAEALKKELQVPAWAKFVKTGMAKERPPENPDWWFIRAASILRKVHRYGPIGVNKLSVQYGSKKNRGAAREHFKPAARKILRTILIQLEQKGFVVQVQKGQHKGRVVTPKGQRVLETIRKP